MKQLGTVIIALLGVLCLTNAYGQDQAFRSGWENGYKQGWCYGAGYGCVEPVVPICPVPAYGEEGYTAGYNRGFLQGKQDKGGVRVNTQPSGPGEVRYGQYPSGTVPTVKQDIPFDAIMRANAAALERRNYDAAEKRVNQGTSSNNGNETRNERISEKERRRTEKERIEQEQSRAEDIKRMQQRVEESRLELDKLLKAAEQRRKAAELETGPPK